MSDDRGMPIPTGEVNRAGLGKSMQRSGGCSSGYTITLDAVGTEHQPDTAGDYVEVCSADGIPVYRYQSFNLERGTELLLTWLIAKSHF